MPIYTLRCPMPDCNQTLHVEARMSEASNLPMHWCDNCNSAALERVYTMNLVGLELFRGIEGRTTKETLDHWTERGRAAGLDPVPVDQHSYT